LDFHLSSRYDWHRFGPLPDRHADLEEMFQLTSDDGGTTSSTIGSTHAELQPTPDPSCKPGNHQSGLQIKCVHPHSHQHLVKKLPEERENYWNNIQSDINDEF
jgi:hypothetical protein